MVSPNRSSTTHWHLRVLHRFEPNHAFYTPRSLHPRSAKQTPHSRTTKHRSFASERPSRCWFCIRCVHVRQGGLYPLLVRHFHASNTCTLHFHRSVPLQPHGIGGWQRHGVVHRTEPFVGAQGRLLRPSMRSRIVTRIVFARETSIRRSQRRQHVVHTSSVSAAVPALPFQCVASRLPFHRFVFHVFLPRVRVHAPSWRCEWFRNSRCNVSPSRPSRFDPIRRALARPRCVSCAFSSTAEEHLTNVLFSSSGKASHVATSRLLAVPSAEEYPSDLLYPLR